MNHILLFTSIFQSYRRLQTCQTYQANSFKWEIVHGADHAAWSMQQNILAMAIFLCRKNNDLN